MNTNKVHQDFKASQWKLETPYLFEKKKWPTSCTELPFQRWDVQARSNRIHSCLLLHKYPEKAMLATLHMNYTTALVKIKELTV